MKVFRVKLDFKKKKNLKKGIGIKMSKLGKKYKKAKNEINKVVSKART